MSEIAIGIDLGTTYSVVAVYKDDQVHMIHNGQGLYTTPSCVSFTDSERLLGEPAKERALLNPENTVFGVKRFLGRTYDDYEFQQNLLSFTYNIIDKDNKPMIEVFYKNERCQFSPEEISAMILEVMKNLAETYLQCKVTKAVITVPAHFNDAQRQATKDAGRIAELHVLRIINEPTAAALAYGLHNKYKEMKKAHTILIYDFGGGTFDVSIITIENGVFEVKTTNGEAYLGGDDIDINLTHYFVQEFNKKHKIDLNKNKKAIRRLRHQCEKLKKNLSFAENATIDIDMIHIEGGESYDLSSSLTRLKFEQINSKLFDKTLVCVKKALKDASLKKTDIDEIILIGGSSRIPRVRELVQKFFGKKLNDQLNPDEAVARGAAIQAAILTDHDHENSELSLLLHDVNPLSLGIETIGGEMSVIIPRNSQLPTTKTERYETSDHNTTEVLITVFEGEGSLVCRNRKLGEFVISGIPPKPRGEVEFDVVFDVNVEGILNVTACQIDGDLRHELVIDSRKGHLSEDEIKKMIDTAEKHREADEKLKEKIRSTIELTQYVNDFKDNLMDWDLEEDDDDFCRQKCDEIIDWMQENEVTPDICQAKIEELKNAVLPITQKYK